MIQFKVCTMIMTLSTAYFHRSHRSYSSQLSMKAMLHRDHFSHYAWQKGYQGKLAYCQVERRLRRYLPCCVVDYLIETAGRLWRSGCWHLPMKSEDGSNARLRQSAACVSHFLFPVLIKALASFEGPATYLESQVSHQVIRLPHTAKPLLFSSDACSPFSSIM